MITMTLVREPTLRRSRFALTSLGSLTALGLFACLSAIGCRDAPPKVTPDPIASAAPKSSSSSAIPTVTKKSIDDGVSKATVTTNSITLPRAGSDPVILELPVVKGLADVKIDDAVNAIVSPKNILGESIDDVRNEAKAAKPGDVPTGVQGTTYLVGYNDQGVLQIDAITQFNGAYPSSEHFRAVIDLRRGEMITAAKSFRAAKIASLVTRLDAMLQAEVKASDAVKDKDFADLVHDAKFVKEDLDGFAVSDKGVTFHHEYGFPHVALALEPAGDFFFAWKDLETDLDPHGPLARIHPVP